MYVPSLVLISSRYYTKVTPKDDIFPVISHYLGDHTVFQPLKHGNAKKTNRPFYPTNTQTITMEKELLKTHMTPKNIYYKVDKDKAKELGKNFLDEKLIF